MNLRHILLILTIAIAESLFAIDINRMALSSRRITSADGLSGNTVYDIVQDKDGFIWMGAAYGLCRYDGYSFVNYYSLSSDASRKIEANTGDLHLDEENGLLWIHTSTFTFACYNTHTGRFVDYTGRGDETRPYRRYLRAGNTLWMYDTQSGVRKITCRNGSLICTDYTQENGQLPSNNVPRMVEDGAHNIWIMTAGGLAVADTAGNIRTVVKDRKYYAGNCYKGNILCLSEGNTVEMYAPNGRRISHTEIPAKYGNVKVIRSDFVWQDKWLIFSGDTYCIDLKRRTADKTEEYMVSNGLLLDHADGYFFESNNSGNLWIFAPDGSVEQLHLIENTNITAERRRKFNIRRGHDGLFYIASYGNGLFVYNPQDKALRHFSASDPQPVIDSNFLMGLYIDRNGNLWVVQDAAGVSLIAVSSMAVADFMLPAPQHRGDWANWVRMAAQQPQGDIVVATKDNKLHTIDMNSHTITSTYETRACVFAYMTDAEGHTWMVTRGDGIYVDGTHYSKYDKDKHILTNDFYDIKMDAHGRVWLASYENGLFMTRYNNGDKLVFKQYLDRSLNERRLHLLELDNEQRLWIASSNGLYVVDTKLDEITDNDFKCFNTTNGLFPLDELRGLAYAEGYIWAGGKGGGLVRCRVVEKTQGKGREITLKDMRKITAQQGLADNSVNAIACDRFGSIWAATESGLSRIYDNDMKVKTFTFGNDPARNCYSEGCALQLKDGRLLFGTRYGMTIITPKRNYDSEHNRASDVCITDMRINGISVCDSNTLGLLVNNMQTVRLKHNENTISLSFSNFEYADIESSLYQYYLEGNDETWRPMTSVNHVEYGNLAPGTYTLHLRALSNNKWSREKTLVITISQPWYNTWWAWLIYIAVAAALIFYIYTNAREKLRLHQQMKLEKQLTEFRLNFFTSIAHEFRTPLAIIQGAINKMQDGKQTSRAALQTARRGTKRLLKLVNMLMEFRKVNTGNMKLQVEEGDIITFVRDIYQDFWNVSKQKDIQTTFRPFERHHTVAFDRQMLETMVYNLLSNAVKYTPERGSITVTIRHEEDMLTIAVEDNGPGISDDRLANLFKPFMQGDVSQGGMGIGLYTAHSMAQLHKGCLTYARRNGNESGSIFTITLPADSSAYGSDDYRKAQAINRTTGDTDSKGDENKTAALSEAIIKEMKPEAINDVLITIIEDDADMMEQISGEIGTFFHTDCYTMGQNGMEGVKEKLPSLVICDVMLPDVSGYDVVKRLKDDDATAHIPVIMLTALDDDRHRMKSYEAGADDYMVKPCNFNILMARAVQLIKKSQKTMTSKKTETDSDKENEKKKPKAGTDILTSVADKNFIDKMDKIIAQRISDPNLTIDQIAASLNMGRTKFFTKAKELTGVSPNKYLQNERMRIAASLLEEGELTVAEISYKVGILDASYFNKCFKSHYGVVPSKYGKGTATSDDDTTEKK